MISLRLFTHPGSAWQELAEEPGSLAFQVIRLLLMAAIPPVCWYYGITQQGWTIAGTLMRMTPESALPICVMMWLASVAGVLFLSAMIVWMSQTYQSEAGIARAVALVSYAATPFFLAGALGLYPLLWFDITVGTIVGCYCVYQLYLGLPAMLSVSPERGFLYASAILAVSLVSLVALMGATVVLWDFGMEPVFRQ